MKWGKAPRIGARKKYAHDEWANYYQSVNGYRPVNTPKRRTGRSGFFRITVVLTMLAVLVVARQLPYPVGEQVRENLRYLLTAEWNFQPLFEKSVQLAAHLVNWDNPVVNGPPGVIEPAAPVTGQNVTDAGLTLPVSGKVVQEYGWFKSSIDDLERFHAGIDISAPAGSDVIAAMDGRVSRVSRDKSLGQYIVIEHGDGAYTLYGGVTDVAVVEGEEVKAGQQIAAVGEGDVPGGGLHFEMREQGKLVDPLAYIKVNSN